MSDDVMSIEAARARLAMVGESIDGDGDGVWRGDPAVIAGLRAEAAALRSVVALHERAAGAWLAGAEAARAGDVAALRAEAERLAGLMATMPAGSTPGTEYVVAGLEHAAALAGRTPLPAPPAPPQCPEAPPDGGTEPVGGGTPARGLPVAAERTRGVVAAMLREGAAAMGQSAEAVVAAGTLTREQVDGWGVATPTIARARELLRDLAGEG